jgi:hypothetical protein
VTLAGPGGNAPDPVAAWTAILDRLEAGLDRPHLPGDLPTGGELGTMPASLRPRAERLLAAQRQLEAELAAQRDAVAEELRQLAGGRARTPRPGASGAPAGVDRLA